MGLLGRLFGKREAAMPPAELAVLRCDVHSHFIPEPQILLHVIFQMQTAGYRPVLAHPERYGFWYNDFSRFERLKERGVLFQLNLVALSGAYGPQCRQIAERLIDAGHYELLGSDCHNMNHVEAIRNTLTRPYLHKLIGSGRLMNSTL